MDSKSQKWLEAGRWTVGDTQDFLELDKAEIEFIEMKIAVAEDLRARRLARHLSQTQVAKIVGSSQSRVAKMEAADPSVSLDRMFRALLQLGAERKDLAKVVAPRTVGTAS